VRVDAPGVHLCTHAQKDFVMQQQNEHRTQQDTQGPTMATLFPQDFSAVLPTKKKRHRRRKHMVGDVSLFGALTREDIWRIRDDRMRRNNERKRKTRRRR